MWLALTLTMFAWTAAIAISDVRRHRIPNRWVVAGLAAALLIRALPGEPGLLAGVGAAALVFVVTFPVFALGGIRAGDVKFAAAAGAFIGLDHLLGAVVYGAIAGGVLALVVAFRRGVPLAALQRTKALAVYLLTFGKRGEHITVDTPNALVVPYGVAIAIGTVAGWLAPLTSLGAAP